MSDYDVVALGELLIDFTENGTDAQGMPLYAANPGGAPCNVLAMLARCGHRTAFIGKVGADAFGRQLGSAIRDAGIDASALREDPQAHTTLAFVHTQPDGDRAFSFYRSPGADTRLTPEEVDEDMIRHARIFHFGTLSSTHEPARSATRHALDVAREAGALISFDPNLRENLWDDLSDARREMEYGLAHCDVLKISDNEMEFLTGTSDYDAGVRMLREKYRLPLVFVTMGPGGSKAYYYDKVVESAPFLLKETIETTGAGDTFTGCALHDLLQHGMEDRTEADLAELLAFANAGAAIVTTRRGALGVMPTPEEIETLLAR